MVGFELGLFGFVVFQMISQLKKLFLAVVALIIAVLVLNFVLSKLLPEEINRDQIDKNLEEVISHEDIKSDVGVINDVPLIELHDEQTTEPSDQQASRDRQATESSFIYIKSESGSDEQEPEEDHTDNTQALEKQCTEYEVVACVNGCCD